MMTIDEYNRMKDIEKTLEGLKEKYMPKKSRQKLFVDFLEGFKAQMREYIFIGPEAEQLKQVIDIQTVGDSKVREIRDGMLIPKGTEYKVFPSPQHRVR